MSLKNYSDIHGTVLVESRKTPDKTVDFVAEIRSIEFLNTK